MKISQASCNVDWRQAGVEARRPMTEDRDSNQGRGAEVGLGNQRGLEDGSDVGFFVTA